MTRKLLYGLWISLSLDGVVSVLVGVGEDSCKGEVAGSLGEVAARVDAEGREGRVTVLVEVESLVGVVEDEDDEF